MHDWWAQRPTQRECIYDHWDVGCESLQMGGPPGRAELAPRCTGTCLRPRRTTSPRWQSVESALDHVRLGSRTKTALNSSTEMQEMLLCPSGMFPGESDAFPLPSTAFQGSVIRSLRLILGSHFALFFFNSVLLRLFPPNIAALDARHTGHASVC